MEDKIPYKAGPPEIIPPASVPELIDPLNAQGKLTLTEGDVKQAEKQIELRSRILMTALRALKAHDIQDFGGKPYLEGEGAARIMAVVRGFGVGEAIFEIEKVENHFFIDCLIPISWHGQDTVGQGDCSTADNFFSGKFKSYKESTGSEALAIRLLVGDAKKKARENALSRAVTELLGLKGLSWLDLSALGFNKTGAGSNIVFKEGTQGAVKDHTPVESMEIAVGSIINIVGVIKSAKERTAAGKTVCDYQVEGPDKTAVMVSAWGGTVEYSEGQEFIFENVKVGTYLNKRQYTAKSIKAKEDETEKKV